jgi:hypothetical protein
VGRSLTTSCRIRSARYRAVPTHAANPRNLGKTANGPLQLKFSPRFRSPWVFPSCEKLGWPPGAIEAHQDGGAGASDNPISRTVVPTAGYASPTVAPPNPNLPAAAIHVEFQLPDQLLFALISGDGWHFGG